MANRMYKQKKRYGLVLLITLFLVGSAVWLKLILEPRLLLSINKELLYLREYHDDNFNVASGLHVQADLSFCRHGAPPPPPPPTPMDQHLELIDAAKTGDTKLTAGPVPPAGCLEAGVQFGLGDHPSTTEETCTVVSSSISPAGKGCLINVKQPLKYDHAQGEAVNVHATQPATAVAHDVKVPKCGDESVFVNVSATLDHIEDPVGALYLAVYASNDWENWWQANEIDIVESEFKRENTPVHTYACIGAPGFVYLLGCVKQGWSKSKLWNDDFQPDLADCIQINGVCGASCESKVEEPSFNDPDAWGFHRKSEMHCVVDGCAECSQPDGHDYSRWNDVPRVAPARDEPGHVRIDDVISKGHVGLQAASYIFAVMYVMGISALFLMYVPGIGQRERMPPPWDRLRHALRNHRQQTSNDKNGAAVAHMPTVRSGEAATAEPLIAAPPPRSLANCLRAGTWSSVTPCMASISAAESANMILRNSLGKIASNLKLLEQLDDVSASDVQLVDIFGRPRESSAPC